ncbi:Penicillin-binding protein 4B [compost metagenome]
MEGLKEPQLWMSDLKGLPLSLNAEQVKQIERLKISQVQVVDYTIRYAQKPIAAQLIGSIGQNPERIKSTFAAEYESGRLKLNSEIGSSGLEKTLEPWLRGIGSTSISYFTDAGKRPLQGLDARLVQANNPYYPLKVVTTLDAKIQQGIELLMESMHIKEGAAVVLNAANADVVAMVSRPAYNPNLEENMISTSWRNHAVKAIAPGSIFKTVVAAAALDEGVVSSDETFDCQGSLGKYGFTCWKKEGHGHLTLEEGFAESCNIVFAEVMKRLNSKQLEQYAHQLGLLTEVGWNGFNEKREKIQQVDAEEAGQLFAPVTPRDDEGVLMQSAIGQRDVLVSPLQAANLVVTLLNQGKRYSPRTVQEIRFQTNQVMERYPIQRLNPAEKQIKASTSVTLQKWMQQVVREGTGKGLQGAKWELAGKSGTAQVLVQGNEKVNQWFIGYGPIDHPQYAVSVVIEQAGPNDSNKAIPLFKGIMNLLAESDNP